MVTGDYIDTGDPLTEEGTQVEEPLMEEDTLIEVGDPLIEGDILMEMQDPWKRRTSWWMTP